MSLPFRIMTTLLVQFKLGTWLAVYHVPGEPSTRSHQSPLDISACRPVQAIGGHAAGQGWESDEHLPFASKHDIMRFVDNASALFPIRGVTLARGGRRRPNRIITTARPMPTGRAAVFKFRMSAGCRDRCTSGRRKQNASAPKHRRIHACCRHPL